jgi:gluconokinase
MDYIISIDIGTTSTKGIAFSPSGDEIFKHSISYQLQYPKSGYAEQDPEEMFWAVTECIREVQENCYSSGNLLAVGFSTAMHGLICIDKDHNLLTQMITWADNRSAEEANQLKNTELGQQIYRQTGTPIHAMSPLCKLLWLKKHEPEIFSRTAKFIGIKEYLWFQFFNSYKVDESMASATGLFDFNTFDWNENGLQLTGIDKTHLPELVSVFHQETIGEKWATELNILVGTPFVIGGSDGVLANLGAGATDEKCMAVTIGTSGAVRITTNQPYIDQQMRTFCYVLDKNYFVTGGGMNNGGVILEWLQKKIFPERADLPELMQLAQQVSVGSDGLLFLPYLLGERAPVFNADAKGLYFGIGINHTQAHFIRATIEGITLAIYSIGRVLAENFPKVEKICAGGGFTHSSFWVKMLSDVFGKKVALAESNENSAFGAAMVAMKAIGLINSFSEVKFPDETTVFEPDTGKHQTYQQLLEKFLRIYEKIKDEF